MVFLRDLFTFIKQLGRCYGSRVGVISIVKPQAGVAKGFLKNIAVDTSVSE